MSRDPARAATQFFGGRVCLDFANTLDWRTSEEPQELIPDFSGLLTWSERRGTMQGQAVARLRVLADRDQVGASRVMRNAYELRRAIWSAADSVLAGNRITLDPFNEQLSRLPPQPRLVPYARGYAHELAGDRLEQPLWPVLWSLTAVVVSSDAARIGCCEAKGCGWFFVDESPNRSRLWCSSEVCGNRERARRAYARRLAEL